MTSIIREMIIDAAPEKVWAIIGDFANGPMLTSPGFFSDCRLEGQDVRALTFADGSVARERLIARDEQTRRIVWSWVDEQVVHDNTSMQVLAAGDGRTRLVWIHDTLPDGLAEWLGSAMDQSAPLIKRSIEAAA
jgi:hypothetical protein